MSNMQFFYWHIFIYLDFFSYKLLLMLFLKTQQRHRTINEHLESEWCGSCVRCFFTAGPKLLQPELLEASSLRRAALRPEAPSWGRSVGIICENDGKKIRVKGWSCPYLLPFLPPHHRLSSINLCQLLPCAKPSLGETELKGPVKSSAPPWSSCATTGSGRARQCSRGGPGSCPQHINKKSQQPISGFQNLWKFNTIRNISNYFFNNRIMGTFMHKKWRGRLERARLCRSLVLKCFKYIFDGYDVRCSSVF